MLVTITDGDRVVPLTVDASTALHIVIALVESEFGVGVNQLVLFRNGSLVQGSLDSTMQQLQIQDGDMLRVSTRVVEQRRVAQQIAQLEADPFNEEAQRHIEHMIQQQRIDESLHTAMEHTPEAFASVTMLYISCEINRHPLKAFVDSGAQTTIMPESMARTCGLSSLIDTRFAGIAKGVGEAKILGRVHIVQMKLGTQFVPLSITVVDNNAMPFLFGLDMLRKHRACIDLAQNCLIIADEHVPFLPESELPNASSTLAALGTPVGPSDAAVNETDIKVLTDLGFSRTDSIAALRQSSGNVDVAASLLFH